MHDSIVVLDNEICISNRDGLFDMGTGLGSSKRSRDPLVQLVGFHPMGCPLKDVDKDVEFFRLGLVWDRVLNVIHPACVRWIAPW